MVRASRSSPFHVNETGCPKIVLVRFRHSSIGFKGTLNSRLKKLVTSVPSSGRPTCDITPRTSGIEAITSRSRGAIRADSASEVVRGMMRPDPEVSLLELRHELTAERRHQAQSESQQPAHEEQE